MDKQKYVDYRINGVPHRAQRELSVQEIDDIAERFREAGMDDPKAREQEKMGREELMLNKGLKDAYKLYYKKRNGKNFEGNDEELVDDYLEQMRFYEANLGSLGTLAAQLAGNYYNQQERAALNVMFDAWDRTVPLYAQKSGKWKGLVDYVQATVTDPSNWAAALATSSIVGSPVLLSGRQASKEATKEIIKAALRKGLTAGAIEGGLVSGTQDLTKQSVEMKLGRRDQVDLGQTAKATGVGAAVGGTVGGVVGGGGAVISSKLAGKEATQQVTERIEPTLGGIGAPKGPKNPKMTQAEADAAMSAGEKFRAQYQDPNVTGPARKTAREEYYDSLASRSRQRFEQMGSRLGKPMSYDEAKKSIDGWMTKVGVQDSDDLYTIVEKVANHKLQPTDISEYTVLVNTLEEEAFDRLQTAKRTNGDTLNAARSFIQASGLASTLSENLGRGLSFQSKRFRDSYDFMTMTQIINGIGNATSPAEARGALKLLDDKVKKGMNLTAGAVNEIFRYNVLGGVETLTTAGLSSMVRMVEKPTTRLFASALSTDAGLARQAVVQYAELATNVFGSLKYAAKSFYHSKNYLGGSQFVEGQAHAPVIGTDLPLHKVFLPEMSLKGWGNSLANAHRLVGRRSMMAIDEFVGQMAFKSRVMALSLEEELAKGKPLTQAIKDGQIAAKEAFEAQLDATLTGKAPQNRLALQGIREADEVRFMQPLEKQGDFLGAIGTKVTEMRDNSGPVMSVLMNQIFPFIRSPINLTNYAFEKTPGLSLLSKRFRDDLASGGQRASEAEANLYIGSMLWSAAIVATTFEYVNGAGPVNEKGTPDKNRGDVQRLGGNMPNSILIDPQTGKRVDIKRGDPYTKQLMVMGAVHDVIRYGTPEDQQKMVAALSLTTAKSLMDTPALTGIKDLVDSLDSVESMESFGQRRVGSFVPLFRIMSKWSDDDYKQAQSVLDELKKNIPGLSESVDDKRDPIFGSPVKRLPQLGMTFNYTYESDDPVLKEVLRLAPSIAPPEKKPSQYGGRVDLTKYRMPTGRTVYDHYQDKVSKLEINGKNLYEHLKEITESPYYTDSLTDPFVSAGVRTKGSKATEIQAAIQLYRENALAQVMKDPKVPNALKQAAAVAENDHKATKSQEIYLQLEKLRRQ